MYIVVFRNISDTISRGCITWTDYKSKEQFDKMNTGNMLLWYEVVEEGVTRERAQELCSTPAAKTAADLHEIGESLQIASHMFSSPTTHS